MYALLEIYRVEFLLITSSIEGKYWLAVVQDGWHWTRCRYDTFTFVFIRYFCAFFLRKSNFQLEHSKWIHPITRSIAFYHWFCNCPSRIKFISGVEFSKCFTNGNLNRKCIQYFFWIRIKTHLILADCWNPEKQPKYVLGELDELTTTFFLTNFLCSIAITKHKLLATRFVVNEKFTATRS